MKIREFHQYIAPDGTVYELHTASKKGRWVIQSTGWGMPPINYITQRGPFQHGETVKDYFLQPRLIQLLQHQLFCGRDELWAGRGGLLDAIRPNRQATATATVPGVLRRVLPDGSRRDLDVFISSGPQFDPGGSQGWMEQSFRELLRFVAYDPVIYDPTLHTENLTISTTSGGLVFPVTFPIVFGFVGTTSYHNITYAGTWPSFPTITLHGPMRNPAIWNVTTGEKIELAYSIRNPRTVTIDLRYGYKTITDDLGTNLIGTLTSDSDLASWHLAADPEAPGGVNQIYVEATELFPDLGDADQNGVIDYNDLTKINNEILSIDWYTYGADMDQDGKIQIDDYIALETLLLHPPAVETPGTPAVSIAYYDRYIGI